MADGKLQGYSDSSAKRQDVRFLYRFILTVMYAVWYFVTFHSIHYIVKMYCILASGGSGSWHAGAVLNSPVDCLKPRCRRYLVRAFLPRKKVAGAQRKTAASAMPTTLPLRATWHRLLCSSTFLAALRGVSRQSSVVSRCKRSLSALTWVNIGFKSALTHVNVS